MLQVDPGLFALADVSEDQITLEPGRLEMKYNRAVFYDSQLDGAVS